MIEVKMFWYMYKVVYKLKLKVDNVQIASSGTFQKHVREENQEVPQRQHLFCFLGDAVPRASRLPRNQTSLPVHHHSKWTHLLSGVCQDEL